MKLTKNSSFKDFADFWLEHYMLGFVKTILIWERIIIKHIIT